MVGDNKPTHKNPNQRRRRWTLGCGIDPFFLFFFEDGALREGGGHPLAAN